MKNSAASRLGGAALQLHGLTLASSPGSSQFFNVARATLKNWEEPGDEARLT